MINNNDEHEDTDVDRPSQVTIEECEDSDEIESQRSSTDDDSDSSNDSDNQSVNSDNQNDSNLSTAIYEVKDPLLNRQDNYVIFIKLDGTPLDKSMKEYKYARLLPESKDLTLERTRVTKIKFKFLIAIPFKPNDRALVKSKNIRKGIASLFDVINELQINSLSIRKTENIDDVSWYYVIKQLKTHLTETPIKKTICKELIKTPESMHRDFFIRENRRQPSEAIRE